MNCTAYIYELSVARHNQEIIEATADMENYYMWITMVQKEIKGGYDV